MTVEDVFESRDRFNEYVYTHWEDAVKELEARSTNAALEAYIEKHIPHGLPPYMEGRRSMVLFRNIATPNYEISRYLICADALQDTLQPLILEYTADKFNNRNEMKFVLGKIPFHKGTNKHGEPIVERKTIIDINASNNVPLHKVETVWGEKLVDFHHELFAQSYPTFSDVTYDLSDWLRELGATARDYYKGFFCLFLKHGILFENYMIDGSEFAFTKEIIAPVLLEIEKESGCKPLIVALEPTHIEGDEFWISHPIDHKQHIDSKLRK